MTQPVPKKQGFKKCRSATFSIDGFSFTIGKTGTFLRSTRFFLRLFFMSQIQREQDQLTLRSVLASSGSFLMSS